MSSVKQLPKSIHSVVRSGVLLYDLTSVVEELVFNSIDSGAKMNSISIGIDACSIKVVDDGSGISRDDLALLGERYATSKYQKKDTEDASPGIFGSRGEALASISDIAVLEITSKAHGRPNGYRKVLKGCECLHFGIDADQKDIGTAVVVRDLFYNQPIRQKSTLSSPKKVLESVKRRILLISFVHPQISFKVVDIDSDDQLLCIRSSATSLPLLSSQYGSELCSSLFKLNDQDGSLKLEGYMSGPSKDFSIKAFQLVYINARPISKGRIHKLVNQVASMFDCEEISVASDGFPQGKRSRTSSGISFFLNLRCPRSWYDLIFEPLKTNVEFKDWDAVLSFVEKTVKCCWKENLYKACNLQRYEVWKVDQNSTSAMTVEEFQESPEFLRKKSRLAYSHKFHDLPFSLDSKECNWLSNSDMREDQPKKCRNSVEDLFFSRDERRYVQCPSELDRPVEKYRSTEWLNCDAHYGYLRSPDSGLLSNHGSSYADDFLLATDDTIDEHSSAEAVNFDAHVGCPLSPEYAMHTKSYADDDLQERILSSARTTGDITGSLFGGKYESLNMDSFVAKTSEMTSTSDYQQQRNNFVFGSGGWRPFKSCSFQTFTEERGCNIRNIEEHCWKTHGYEVRKKNLSIDDYTNFRNPMAMTKWNFGSFSRSAWQHETCSSTPQSGDDMLQETDFLSTSLPSLPLIIDSPANETGLSSDSLSQRFQSSSFKRSADIDILEELEEYGPLCEENCKLEFSTMFTRRDGPCNRYDDYNICNPDIDAKKPYKGNFISNFLEMGNKSEKNYASPFKNLGEQLIREDFPLENSAKDILPDYRLQSQDSHHRIRTSRENAKSREAFYFDKPGCVQIHQERPTRSLSAPPFYRRKTRFKLSNAVISTLKRFASADGKHNSEEIVRVKHPSFGQGVTPMTFLESRDHGTKLRDNYLPVNTNNNSISVRTTHQSPILSTRSGILHLVIDSLVPKSITRDCLASARVLQQIDKKFIPIIAGQTLAAIDQHAADERIRLEELRKKVLSGEVMKVTYLEYEKELVLPEMAHQMLHNYKDQVESWGWICIIRTENSASFQKNFTILKGWPTMVSLIAVPCILGVSLTDRDLLEFLLQLAETDGSSTMPPSVLRVLNVKACRGAIMFGDSLLPSECALLVEELKQTKLCFQCAHGRPTTIPLANLDELHKQVRELRMRDDYPNHPWHGLQRNEINLKRTTNRLHAALR
ncbi:hypothetical protein MLD38_031134 [Melastoma candidum]|uniref:Uncharacterized protein n=1 Tax=Melastoma candidum TaxID=119954 RepID=A0ACB9MQW5_9MYRT|nr:hypothetical protein MLD38_031134 [Melastoma candidum]